ncbi:caspase domain-containing protein [Kitasatospora sp. NPDC092948]|uniref:caspase family protein n=1 Tax=Kitasatospora sp. NPDC092948 TaxID=3364088 RepID=UPI003810D63D
MAKVYALLVGVNEYAARYRPLEGCVNDVAAAERWLSERVPGVELRTLLDGRATVRAVVDGVRGHLGQAGPQDTALLWFSGHGTEFAATAEQLRLEPTGRCQALVCHDGPLLDKELRVVLDGVAAGGGHVVAVLDCCFSGGATRDARGVARYLPPDPSWGAPVPARDVAEPVAARDVAEPVAGPEHVLLAASRLNQLAYEDWFDGRKHGVFTRALLGALGEQGGPELSYRQLMAGVACRVQGAGDRQHPVLAPSAVGGPADRPFLGGAVRPPGPHLLRHGAAGWEVDCGSAHGLRGGPDVDGTEFTVVPESAGTEFAVTPDVNGTEFAVAPEPGGTEFAVTPDVNGTEFAVAPEPGGTEFAVAPEPGGTEFAVAPESAGAERLLTAREVRVDRTLVDPSGWTPDPARTYPVSLSALALPPVAVLVESDEEPSRARELAEVLRAARTPLLRVADGAGELSGTLLRVVLRGRRAEVLLRDGSPAVPALPFGGPGDARRIVDCLTHLAHWHQLRDLAAPGASLASQVRIEVASWDGGEPIGPDGSGEIRCHYTRGRGGWQAPQVSVRIRNRSAGRPLWCVLLNLTEGYASRSTLFPGGFVGPGLVGEALDGDPVQLFLPPGRAVRPGASTRDWLKLIVAEGELNTVPYQFGPWDAERAVARKDRPGSDGVFRPLPPGGSRDMGAGPRPGRWAALTLPLRTVVPE